jgi:hypothetical protein
MEAHWSAQKRRDLFSLKELCQIPARRVADFGPNDCAIRRGDRLQDLEYDVLGVTTFLLWQP